MEIEDIRVCAVFVDRIDSVDRGDPMGIFALPISNGDELLSRWYEERSPTFTYSEEGGNSREMLPLVISLEESSSIALVPSDTSIEVDTPIEVDTSIEVDTPIEVEEAEMIEMYRSNKVTLSVAEQNLKLRANAYCEDETKRNTRLKRDRERKMVKRAKAKRALLVVALAPVPVDPPSATTNPPGICSVCMENSINVIMMPCGHVCACSVCGAQCKGKCPICRRRVKMHPVYYA
jgi:hypothetical protein